MAITSIAQSSAAVSAFGNQAQGGSAQQNPLAGLQRKVASASAQLSAFGKVKLSLDELQAKAQAVSKLSNPPTLSDFSVAVQGVVQSFNALSKTVSAAAASRENNRAAAAAVVDQRPAQALKEVRRAVAGPNDSSLDALQKIGISRQRDGTFDINQKQLEKSFLGNRDATLNTLNDVAARVVDVTQNQLSSNGLVGQRFNNVSARVSELQDARDDVQARLDSQRNFQQLLTAQLANAGGFVARNAVVTYLSVASL